ncbi:S1 family peptidase [Loktanella sp. S4079]|uniref:S1 family peptidase n=1 Tax=Loktanella sp. S4079 TaxID=579483 RepID=UPI000A7CA77F|nr:serine protease [Loktanella sp. S4079]
MVPLTSAILNHVIKIETAKGKGTAFFMRYERQNFLVTAKHLACATQPGDNILCLTFENDVYSEAVDIEHGTDETDISVIKLGNPFYPWEMSSPIVPETGQLLLGQEVVIAGFPLGLEPRHETLFGNKPMPLIKGGIFSGMLERSFEGAASRTKHPQYFLDVHNNKGFSGGPVFATSKNRNTRTTDVHVVAMVSEYFYDRPLGGEATTSNLKPNSGFTVAIPIGKAVEAVKTLLTKSCP